MWILRTLLLLGLEIWFFLTYTVGKSIAPLEIILENMQNPYISVFDLILDYDN